MHPRSLFSLAEHLERLSKDGDPLEVLAGRRTRSGWLLVSRKPSSICGVTLAGTKACSANVSALRGEFNPAVSTPGA